MRPEEIQRELYAKGASEYDSAHIDTEHVVALNFLTGMVDYLGVESVLDVGAGTGRVMVFLHNARPNLRVVGIEPVAELRQVGYRKGIVPGNLIEGNGYELPFRDGEFDLVCEVAVLHHVRHPERVIGEMLRVARKAIFISDSNNFGGGPALTRSIKQGINALGLWRALQFVTTRGKGYHISEGDGLFYSYSVYNNFRQIRTACQTVHVLNTAGTGCNPYRSAPHVALLGLK